MTQYPKLGFVLIDYTKVKDLNHYFH